MDGSLEDVIGSLGFPVGKVCTHGVASVLPVDDAADHGCLHRGRDMNGHGAGLIGSEGAEGIFELQFFAVVKNSHGSLLEEIRLKGNARAYYI